MKKTTTILVVVIGAILVASVWLAICPLPRYQEITPVAHITSANKVQSPSESSDISIEAMIENITTLFEQNAQGKQNPVSYGDKICLRILNETNHVEQTALARRYTDVLMAMPLDRGSYFDRVSRLDHICRMAEHWGNTMYQIKFDPKMHICFLLAVLGNFRDAVENGWQTEASIIEAQFVETNVIQQLDRSPPDKRLCIGGYRGRLGPFVNQGKSRTSRDTFVRYAIMELRNLVMIYKDRYIPAVLPHLSSGELGRIEKDVEERIKSMNIEKLVEAMEKDVKR